MVSILLTALVKLATLIDNTSSNIFAKIGTSKQTRAWLRFDLKLVHNYHESN